MRLLVFKTFDSNKNQKKVFIGTDILKFTMTENRNADYYLESLKKKGLKSDEFNEQRFMPSSENDYFPNEKVFMNWLIELDYSELRTIGEMLFSVYSSPSSEQNIVINKYLKENNKDTELSDLIDECTEKSLYALNVLTSLKDRKVDELISIHNEIFKGIDGINEKLHNIIKGSLENFKQNKEENKKDHYIG